VGFFDTLLGRSRAAKPDLDQLFAIPSAALTLQAATAFAPTGVGSVCYRAAEGAAFASMQADVQQLLDADEGPDVERITDSFGFTWLICRAADQDMSALVTDLHAVNTSLESNGFGPSLLCSMVVFADDTGRRLGLVYLYKQGTFYPFAPLDAKRRDNPLELQVRGVLANDLRIEPELGRWLAVWGAPGLDG
jgi:hypothetical protein